MKTAGVMEAAWIGMTQRTQTKMTKGLKYDEGKPLMGALPPNAELAIAQVLTFGANKYGRDNWRLVDEHATRYMDALLRHVNAYRRGEKLDEESGKSHLAHAGCCLMFLLESELES